MFVVNKSIFEMHDRECERAEYNFGEQQEEGLMFLRSAGSRAQFFPRRGTRCEQRGKVGGCSVAAGGKRCWQP